MRNPQETESGMLIPTNGEVLVALVRFLANLLRFKFKPIIAEENYLKMTDEEALRFYIAMRLGPWVLLNICILSISLVVNYVVFELIPW